MTPTTDTWVNKRRSLLPWIIVLTVLGFLKLSWEFPRLLWYPVSQGGKDLSNFYGYVQGWFVGADIYAGQRGALYPPASMVMAWPLLGWLPFSATRWLWCATSVLGLAALVWLTVRGSGATSLQKVFAALMILGANATGVVIGNGQSTLLVLPLVLGGIWVLHNGKRGWATDLTGATLLLGAMFKPSLAIPFLPLAIVFPSGLRWRPLLLIGVGYMVLTLFSASYQHADLISLFRVSSANGTRIGMYVADGNLLYLMRHLGLVHFALPASALLVGCLSWWLYRNREQDLWILLGVAAIVARMWTYHRVYDDVVVIFASVALFRIAAGLVGPNMVRHIAASLLAVTILVMMPLPFLTGPGVPTLLSRGLIVVQSLIWLTDAIFLIKYCGHKESAPQLAPLAEAAT